MVNEFKIFERNADQPRPKESGAATLQCHGSLTDSQFITVGGTSLQSNTFNDGSEYIDIKSSVECWYKIGENPTAVATTAGNEHLDVNERLSVRVTSSDKIAVIQA